MCYICTANYGQAQCIHPAVADANQDNATDAAEAGPQAAEISGLKWGARGNGNDGGVVKWSIAGAGNGLADFGIGGSSQSFGQFNFDVEAVLQSVFDEWSAAGEIDFVQVEDPGGAANTDSNQTIRVFAAPIPGSTIGIAFFPTFGDMVLDTSMANNERLFRQVALHEVGHALGFEHTSDFSIMQPTVGGISNLTDVDLQGARTVYGTQNNAAETYNLQFSEQDLTFLDTPDNLTINGNSRDNRIEGTSSGETINGGFGADRLIGNGGDDDLTGDEGQDALFGGNGRDRLEGRSDNDDLNGESGDDALYGGSGNDDLHGGRGRDALFGGNGNDMLIGGADGDSLDGGGGVDTLSYDGSSLAITIDLTNQLAATGGASGDTFRDVEIVLGSRQADRIRGDSDANTVFGGNQGDVITGRSGEDVLDGGQGNDTLFGNTGSDELTGGIGADRFTYNSVNDSRAGIAPRDVITDFGTGNDRIQLSRIDADETAGGNQAFRFIANAQFSGDAGELRFSRSAPGDFTLVQGDTDGDGRADLHIELSGLIELVANDFIL